MTQETCRACHGRMTLPNVKTGEPCACPICGGMGVTEPPMNRLPFWYVIDQVLTALQSISSALQINSDADFEWVWLSATFTGTFTTQLQDASSRAYQNSAVNNANQWGTAQLPLPLVQPMVLRARSLLKWTLTDTSNAGNTVELALIGFELYPA
jgi:hypothetical protein